MKLSIAWLFDHIDARMQDIAIPDLITKLNETTAEIEQTQTIKTDLSHMALAQIIKVEKKITAQVPEWNTSVTLSERSDAYLEGWYLIIKEDKAYRWARSTDLGSQKEMLLAAINNGEKMANGNWKQSFETHDVICTVDNKSITHRPDLWGHRGFAREVASILDLPMRPLDDFLRATQIIPHEWHAEGTATNPFSLTIKDAEQCRRFAGYYLSEVTPTPSLLWMMTRLSRVDARTIDALVDFTNYVMLDLSQPMHAFDADRLASTAITVRRAQNKEKLTLLDDQTIELTDHDLVIADGDQPISLAGIMGGISSGISRDTMTVFLESANFNATAIRRSAQRHKLRSEASVRFEKSLDPNQNTVAIERFLKLLDDAQIAYRGSDEIASLGPLLQPQTCIVSHRFIETRLGTSIASSFIEHTLCKLDFGVRAEKDGDELIYHITIPPFRATKDIEIKEDIVEEVGRFYGWSSITPTLPFIQTEPKPVHAVMQTNRIKHLLSFGLCMRELNNYSFFDESFLNTIGWDPGKTLQVKDPVSENWQRLVTTLIPSLLRAVDRNATEYDELRFYEWARIWEGTTQEEKKSLAGIFYHKKKKIDFYDCKAYLHQLFELLSIKTEWQAIGEQNYPWVDEVHTAIIVVDGTSIGTAGIVDARFFKEIADGSAFIFELNADFLQKYEPLIHRFTPISKYPAIERDVTALAPLSLTVAQMTSLMRDIDPRITAVHLVDMFQKKEWGDERAVTFRYRMQDAHTTLTKQQADAISVHVHAVLEKAGAEIR